MDGFNACNMVIAQVVFFSTGNQILHPTTLKCLGGLILGEFLVAAASAAIEKVKGYDNCRYVLCVRQEFAGLGMAGSFVPLLVFHAGLAWFDPTTVWQGVQHWLVTRAMSFSTEVPLYAFGYRHPSRLLTLGRNLALLWSGAAWAHPLFFRFTPLHCAPEGCEFWPTLGYCVALSLFNMFKLRKANDPLPANMLIPSPPSAPRWAPLFSHVVSWIVEFKKLFGRGPATFRTTQHFIRQLEGQVGSPAFSPEEMAKFSPWYDAALRDYSHGYDNGHLRGFVWFTAYTHLTRGLRQRYEMNQLMARNPSIAKIGITRPIFIVGLHRTASTMFHRLLAVDAAARAPHMWELLEPTPPPEKATFASDPRRDKAKQIYRFAEKVQPDVIAEHECDFDGPEECMMGWTVTAPITGAVASNALPSVMRMFAESSTLSETIYSDYKRVLQTLSSKFPPESHWVLKCPLHLLRLDTILNVFPDAEIVWIHRRPRESVASWCRITNSVATASHNHLTGDRVGRVALDLFTSMISQGMAARDKMQREGQFHDIQFTDVIADPVGVVEQLYSKLGKKLTAETRESMVQFVANWEEQRKKKAERFPGVRAGLSDFGLTDEDMHAFDDYEARFGLVK